MTPLQPFSRVSLTLDGFERFLNAHSPDDAQWALKACPELLGSSVEQDLAPTLSALLPTLDEHARDYLSFQLDVLRRCRALGTTTAYAEITIRRCLGPSVADDLEALIRFNEEPASDPTLCNRRLTLLETLLGRADEVADDHLRAQLRGAVLQLIAHSHWDWSAMADRVAHMEAAVAAYEHALQFLNPDMSSLGHAQCSFDLAACLLQCSNRDLDATTKRVITILRDVLTYFTPDRAPKDHGMTQVNLSAAYARLPTGDWQANLERSLECLQAAHAVFTPERFPVPYASAEADRGTCYFQIPTGDRDTYVRKAIACYEEALRYLDPKLSPFAYARAKSNLGLALAGLPSGNPEDNLQRAIGCYEDALTIRTPERAPLAYAMTQLNLGDAYAALPRDQISHLNQAIHCYHEALRFWTAELAPMEYAMAVFKLASSYAKQPANRRVATTLLDRALALTTPDASPTTHRELASLLGSAHFAEGHWEEAYMAYAAALESVDRLYAEATLAVGRQLQLSSLATVVPNAAYALTRLGRTSEAVECLERGRAQLLADAMALENVALRNAKAKDRGAFEHARDRVRLVEVQTRAWSEREMTPDERSRSFLALSNRAEEARKELSESIDRIRAYVPAFMSAELSYEEIAQAVAPSRPLTYLFSTSYGTLALIVTGNPAPGDEPHVLSLDAVTNEFLVELLLDEDPAQGRTSYLRAQAAGDVEAIEKALGHILPVLRETVTQALASGLRSLGATETTLVPVGRLSVLPLPAAAPDDLTIGLIPSGRLLRTATDGLTRQGVQTPTLVAAGNPATSRHDLEPLSYAEQEVDTVAKHFLDGSRRLLSPEKATLRALREQTVGATHLHLACHGEFNEDTPLNSCLYLAGQDRLTLRHLMDGDLDVSSIRIAVLSACDSGLNESKNVPDEWIGLPAGFLQCGVSGVVATLWPVDDLSTAVLAERFYIAMLKDHADPASALKHACMELRDGTAEELRLTTWYEARYTASGETDEEAREAADACRSHPAVRPFHSPLYWAGFVFVGA